jgi:hypothetical protein
VKYPLSQRVVAGVGGPAPGEGTIMFWDWFIRRVWLTLGGVLPDGLTAAANVFAEAHRRHLFALPAVDELSILLLVLTCPQGTVLRTRAEQEFTRRGIGALAARQRVWDLLTALGPPRTTELLTLFHRGAPAQRGLAADLLMRHHGPHLALFLGRLSLTDPDSQRPQAITTLTRALGRFTRIPLGTIDFPCYLYRRALAGLSAAAPPAGLPSPPLPAWLTGLPTEERRFLACCLGCLSLAQRIAVYLSFYAGLDADQIRCVQSAHQTWTRAAVLTELAQSYTTIIRNWQQVHLRNGD